ncbi:hypothetical protein F9B16_08935 [Actinomadura montaniterrae]|uniref:Uncharacterized protein n=1 Tax=Actinomadura montaniterrae TaxID=1803903 RepID=A0A6L3VXK2_9ACTN|nr:hypothetical protein F9B16_08935 [Actinomadura montaniterrae]
MNGPLATINGHARLLEASATRPAAEPLETTHDAVETMRHLFDVPTLPHRTIRDLPSLRTRTVVENPREPSCAVMRVPAAGPADRPDQRGQVRPRRGGLRDHEKVRRPGP